MSDVFRHAGWAFGQVYENLRALAIDGNFLWFVTVFPLIPIVGIPASSALERAMLQVEGPVNAVQFFVIIVVGTGLTGFLAGPGTAGLFHVAQRHLDGEDTRVRDFLHGFRAHFMRAWFLFIIDMFLLYGLVMGFIFYTSLRYVPIPCLSKRRCVSSECPRPFDRFFLTCFDMHRFHPAAFSDCFLHRDYVGVGWSSNDARTAHVVWSRTTTD